MSLMDFAAPIISFVSQQNEYNRQLDMAKQRQDMMNGYYQRQMDNVTSEFNRNYYRNYLDNANARNMLKQVREQLGEQSKAARNRAAVTGATGEAVAAVQKYNNRALDNVVGSLAAAEETGRESAASLYDTQRQQLDNLMMASTMKYYDDYSALSKAMSENNRQLWLGLGSKYANRYGDFLNQQAGSVQPEYQQPDYMDETYMMP